MPGTGFNTSSKNSPLSIAHTLYVTGVPDFQPDRRFTILSLPRTGRSLNQRFGEFYNRRNATNANDDRCAVRVVVWTEYLDSSVREMHDQFQDRDGAPLVLEVILFHPTGEHQAHAQGSPDIAIPHELSGRTPRCWRTSFSKQPTRRSATIMTIFGTSNTSECSSHLREAASRSIEEVMISSGLLVNTRLLTSCHMSRFPVSKVVFFTISSRSRTSSFTSLCLWL